MPDKFRIADIAIGQLLIEWDRLWSIYGGQFFDSDIFHRVNNPDTSDLPPVRHQGERSQRQTIVLEKLRDIGIQLSIAASERELKTDALDRINLSPRDARTQTGIEAALTIDTLRFMANPTRETDKPSPPDPNAPDNPINMAVLLKANNPRLSVRAAAKAVGISYSKLQRSSIWKNAVERLKQVGKGRSASRED